MHSGQNLTNKQIEDFISSAFVGINEDAKKFWMYTLKHHDKYAKDAIAYILTYEDDYLNNDDLYQALEKQVEDIEENWDHYREFRFGLPSIREFRLYDIIDDSTRFSKDIEIGNTQAIDTTCTLLDESYRNRKYLFKMLSFHYYRSIKNHYGKSIYECVIASPDNVNQTKPLQVDQSIEPPKDVQQVMQYLVDNGSVFLSDEAFNGKRRYIALISPGNMGLKKNKKYGVAFYHRWIYQRTVTGEIKPYSLRTIEEAYKG